MEVNNTFCSHLSGALAFGIESGLLMLLGTASVLMNGMYVKVLLNCGGHLPRNTKLLLINCSFASLFKSMYFGFYFPLYNFFLGIFGFDTLVVSRSTCLVISSLYGISAYVLPISVTFIACERLYSTWKKNLAQVDRISADIVAAQVAVWTIGILVYVAVMFLDTDVSKTVCYCYFPMLIGPSGGVMTNTVLIGTQSINVILYAYIYWKNKQNLFEFTLNTARYSLSERFVMWASVQTTLMLLPVSLLHASTTVIVTVSNRLLREAYNYKVTSEYLCATIGVLCLMAVDSLGHPLLCLKFSKALQEIAAKFYPKIFCCIRKSDVEDLTVNTVATSVRQKNFYPVTNVHRSHFNRPIIEFRIKPEQHRDMLIEMWNKDIKGKGPLQRYK